MNKKKRAGKKNNKKQQSHQKNLELKRILPKTQSQEDVFCSYDDDLNLVLSGCAGTGKTFLSLYLALEDVLLNNTGRTQIKIFRSAVMTRDIGFAKGSITEKMAIYESPYIAIVNELLNCGTAYTSLKARGDIEFLSTSYNRGITINDSVIIVDESQNMTDHELSTIITRMGRNSRIIFCGDTQQMDLDGYKEKSGMDNLIRIANYMKSDFKVVHFSPDDIVRNDLIKRYIKTRIKLGV